MEHRAFGFLPRYFFAADGTGHFHILMLLSLRGLKTRLSPSSLLLLAILAAALVLRLYGVNWDSGHGFHPDERSLYLRAGCMFSVLTESLGYDACLRDFPQMESGIPSFTTLLDAERSPLNPHWFPLGSVLIYLMVLFRSVIELFTDVSVLDMRYVGRPISALFDVGSIFMVYVLGKKMFGQRTGLLAAGLVAFSVIHIQHSHFYRPETLSVFFLLATFWAMLRVLERGRFRDSLVLGAMVGLAMAPKVSVLPLVLPIGLVYLWRIWDSAGRRWSGITIDKIQAPFGQVYAAGAVALVVFFLLTPYALLDFRTFMADLVAQTEMARNPGMWPFTYQYVDTPPFIYQFHQTIAWGLGVPLGIVAWLSIPFALLMVFRNKNSPRYYLLILALVVPNLLFLETFEVKFLRYVFHLMPFLILLGSRMLWWLLDKARERAMVGAEGSSSRFMQYLPKVVIGLMVLVIGTTIWYALAFETIYSRDHPAVAASEWMQENISPRTTVISDTHWDDSVPGIHRYDFWQFEVYQPDGAEKMTELAGRLANAEYLVFYSNRPYGSVARLPEHFPLSSRYYQLLFQGELGYRLEKSFTSYPRFLGVALRDDPFGRADVAVPSPFILNPSSPIEIDLGYADDNVVGYDHPQVLVFRNVDRRSRADLARQLLSSPPSPPAGVAQDRAPLGLMLNEADKAAQREGGTWSRLYSRDGWASRMPALAWLVVVELGYLITLPLGMVLFRSLPDRGVILARILAFLVIGYLAWLMVSLGWLTFSKTAILLAALLTAAASAVALALSWKDIFAFVQERWKFLISVEALFLLAFCAFILIRMANPDLWHPFRGGEKPMELAYLNAVARSTTMPPYDPWFAGGHLNYYYWGYFLVSLPMRLTGIVPTVGFNLAVPLFFALTFTGAFSLIYNLAEMFRRSGRKDGNTGGLTPDQERHESLGVEVSASYDTPPGAGPSSARRWLRSPFTAGIFAALLVAVLGNLDGMIQMVQKGWYQLSGGGTAGPFFDFWRSSRMIAPLEEQVPSGLAFWLPSATPGFSDVSFHITEFPFFTFLFADLHAHMMVIPFTLLVLGLGMNLVIGSRREGLVWTGLAGMALALALGSLWVINSWDYPPYLVLSLAFLGISALGLKSGWLRRALWLAVMAFVVVALSVVFFLPFHQNYETFDAGMSASKWSTPMESYLAIHGLFVFVAATFLLHKSWSSLSGVFGRLFPRGDDPGLSKGTAAMDRLQLVLLGALLFGAAYLGLAGYWNAAALLILLGLTGFTLIHEFFKISEGPYYSLIPYIFLGMAICIGIGVDFIRLDGDIGRMNTLFKLYLEAWVLYGLATAFMLWYLVHQGWFSRPGPPKWPWAKLAWVGVLGLLLISTTIYPIFGTKARVNDRFVDTAHTLDGTRFMQQAVHREQDEDVQLKWDLEAISWLQDNVEGTPVVLEAHQQQYHWTARIANYTGLPTVLGWPWHQIQQRTAYSYAIADRARDVEEIYATGNEERAYELLRKYDVEYVVVGQLERAYYPEPGLEKFERMVGKGLAFPVFRNQGINIYRILW